MHIVVQVIIVGDGGIFDERQAHGLTGACRKVHNI